LCAGCGEKAGDAKASAEAKASVDKGEVLVEVNGKKLTRGEVDNDIEKLIVAQQVPKEHLEEAKKMFGRQLAQMFLQNTLLVDEAAKKGVKLTDEDRKKREAEFLKSVAGRPDAPKTLEDLLKRHPLGLERARVDFENSILIQKLLDQEVLSKIKIDEKKVADEFAAATSNYTAAVKAAAGAEGKIKDLAKQLAGLTGAALTNKFAQLAKENSDCPSKNKGGDLGLFTRGQMVPEFDKVAFDSKPLTVSAPVKTQFGWHLVLVTKKEAAVAAKGDTPASPEKVQASHILVSARAPEKAPTKADIEAQIKRPQEMKAVQHYFEALRKAAKIAAPGFPELLPKAAEKPAAKPAAKPAEKPAAKPAEKPAKK
jgi:parvulin-like peptidyl-prolyl isomerase